MSTHRVTAIPGDGTGPEIMAAAKVALAATGVDIAWVDVEAGADVMEKYGTPLPDLVIDSIRQTGVALKGPITTPVGSGFRSVNVALRNALDLYYAVINPKSQVLASTGLGLGIACRLVEGCWTAKAPSLRKAREFSRHAKA